MKKLKVVLWMGFSIGLWMAFLSPMAQAQGVVKATDVNVDSFFAEDYDIPPTGEESFLGETAGATEGVRVELDPVLDTGAGSGDRIQEPDSGRVEENLEVGSRPELDPSSIKEDDIAPSGGGSSESLSLSLSGEPNQSQLNIEPISFHHGELDPVGSSGAAHGEIDLGGSVGSQLELGSLPTVEVPPTSQGAGASVTVTITSSGD